MSVSSIMYCACELKESVYMLDGVILSRIFNMVAFVTDGKRVLGMPGSGMRCVKVMR